MSTFKTDNSVGLNQPVEVVIPAEVRTAAPIAPSGEPGFFFFGGSRRSGTTWVAGMLNAHPEIECRNEAWLFNPLGWSFEEWLNEGKFRQWAERRESQGTWLRHQSADEAILTMRRAMLLSLYKQAVVREKWKDWSRVKWVGDKTTMHFCTNVDTIHAYFPDAKFLHMVRDGRDVVVSDMFLLLKQREYGDLTAASVEQAEKARRYYLEGQGKPVPLFGPDVLEFLVSEWVHSIAGGQRARELFGPGHFELRYERLTEHPTHIRDVLAWLDVERDEAIVNHMISLGKFENHSGGRKRGEADPRAEWRKGVVGDWRNYFTESDKAQFKSMAGELLVELGYERDLGW